MGSRRRLRELQAQHAAYVARMRRTRLTVTTPSGPLFGPFSLEDLEIMARWSRRPALTPTEAVVIRLDHLGCRHG